MNIAKFGRGKVPMVMSQLSIQPVFDVNADVQGRDTRGPSRPTSGFATFRRRGIQPWHRSGLRSFFEIDWPRCPQQKQRACNIEAENAIMAVERAGF